MRHSCSRDRSARPPVAALAIALLVLCGPFFAPPAAWGTPRWSWPVEGEVVTRYDFGADPYAAGQHRGIDIAAPVGEPVAAATAGTVTFAGDAASSGLTVSVRTADGRFDTSYLHLDSLAVEEGDRVEEGSELGAVGVSGKPSAADPHLHFGVRDAGERHDYRNPLLFLGREPPLGGPPPAPLPTWREPRSLPRPVRPLPGPAAMPAPKGIPVAAGVGSPAAAAAAQRQAPRPGDAPVREPLPAAHPDAGDAPAAGPGLSWALAGAGLAVTVAALAHPFARPGRRRKAPGEAPRARPLAERA